ncbi:peptidoglycan DD-metalloendopeptidase family protein [Candidatus Falkowbacteria bacterium]|nr:peptidoglycan DD-metalloendopeptidase family protein [Candidatus Falkowbacteria bacterium]
MFLYFYKISRALIISGLFLFLFFSETRAQSIDEFNQQIQNKEQTIVEIKKKAAVYQKNIRIKQQESITLKNQLSILSNKIAKTGLDIKATETEIQKTKLETRSTELQIISKEDDIGNKKQAVENLLQEIHKSDNENQIKIFLSNNSLSDFINGVEYTKDIQNNLKDRLDGLKDDKKELQSKKTELESKQLKLGELKEELEFEKSEMNGESVYKETLLTQTKNSEQKFAALYAQTKKEQQAISAEIADLEKEMRQKLNQMKKDKPALTDATLVWPIPQNTITAFFHDPDYPFRYIFEHPAVDIRAKHGTPISAPADGYVLKSKDAGMGYSYIALIHANGISTVYGHVSKIFVAEDEFVSKGETIGLTGGTPGTPGAGKLVTGPHLHFEVRVNGIPVNPLDYLP